MTDSFGRVIDYLRISITDRCPMRCVYCMPQEGVEWIPHDEIFSFEEFRALVGIFARLGVKKLKITGGEPLARRGVVPFIASLSRIPGIERISLTTNAVLLDECLDGLVEAGLSAVNISIDSLDRENYRRITRLDACDAVQKTLRRLFATNLALKINCVPLEGINEDDLVPLARLAQKNALAVRFIELMPLGCGSGLKPVPEAKIFALLEGAFGKLRAFDGKLGEGPAVYYSAAGFAGKIGFISSLSHKFCGGCNRIRLTSQGMLKPCLSSDMSLNVKELLRGGGGDAVIAAEIERIVARKPASHSFIVENKIDATGHRSKLMSKIGG
jgi:cyclic pyranopterin phosphate synthase